jgi:trimethylamine--corrinoid protein Co-methyltransferase
MAYGAPEFALINIMCAQLTRYYGLPYFGTGGTTDSKTVDGQAVCEAMMTALPAVLCGTNLIHDIGYMESGMTGSYEMIVAGNEIADMCFRIARGVTIDEDTLATDVIANVGPGGQFLAQKHTIRYLQLGEHWMPTLLDRTRFETWSKAGSKDFTTRIRATVQKILREHQPEPLSEDVRHEIKGVLDQAEKRGL